MDKLGFISSSSECSSGFWFVCSYILTSGVGDGWSSGSQTFLTDSDMETWISGSGRVYVSGWNSISGTTLIPPSSRARDLVTIAEVGSARLASLECVTTGVRSVSRGARAKPNSLGRSLRFPLPDGAVSMTSCPKLLLTDNWKMPDNSGNDYNECSIYHNTMLKTALSTGWWNNWRQPKPFQYLLDQCSSASTMSAARARSRCSQSRRIFTPWQVSRLKRTYNTEAYRETLHMIDVDCS